jgi:hypothetical protein
MADDKILADDKMLADDKLPADDKLLKTYPSPDDKRWIELRQQSDGRFYFQEFDEASDNVPYYGARTEKSPGFRSSLYETAAAAETDIQSMFPWLCEKSK